MVDPSECPAKTKPIERAHVDSETSPVKNKTSNRPTTIDMSPQKLST
jgi:hypothetical protein